MAGRGDGYRPSVVFSVTVLLLLVAGACVVIWIGRAEKVKTQLQRMEDLEQGLVALRADLSPLGVLTKGSFASDVRTLKGRVTTLASDLSGLKRRVDALTSTPHREKGSGDLARTVAALQQRLDELKGDLRSYRTTEEQDRVDRGLQDRVGAVEKATSALPGRVTVLRQDFDELRSNLAAPPSKPLPEETLASLPVGTILPLVPPGGSLRVPRGWALCNGGSGTPDVEGLVLLGTTTASQAGRVAGGGSITIPGHYNYRDAWTNRRPPSGNVIRVSGPPSSSLTNTYWFDPFPARQVPLPAPRHVKVLYIMKIR
jgi:hypothetical protein